MSPISVEIGHQNKESDHHGHLPVTNEKAEVGEQLHYTARRPLSAPVLARHAGDVLKRVRDCLACRLSATVVHTTPQGSSKGKEQPLSPHVLGPTFALHLG